MGIDRSRRRWPPVAWCVTGLLLLGVSASRAGDGIAALKTADPSCADDSGDRYVDCGNGTVTDNQTGLVWLKQGSCLRWCSSSLTGCAVDTDCPGGESCVVRRLTWPMAVRFARGLSDQPADSTAANQDCGLADGSSPGEWRLPSVEEWEAMIADAVALGCTASGSGGPSITDDSGTQCWQEAPGSSFTGVQSFPYWSSSLNVPLPWFLAWGGDLLFGDVEILQRDSLVDLHFVWPVRRSQ